MNCQFCQVNQSNVHVTEVENWQGPGSSDNHITIKHLCEVCAQQQNLPFVGPGAKASAKLWQLMGLASKAEIKTTLLSCKCCGMTQLQLRKKGRVGCPQCYEVFSAELEAMLERIHGATEHTGRTPQIATSLESSTCEATSSTPEPDRIERIGELKGRLEQAIDQEEFEVAADLRDQLADLEENEA